MVTVTAQMIKDGKSYNGAWSLAQLKALLPKEEFNRPYAWPAKGWKIRLIGSKVTQEQVNEFMKLKNKHLGHKSRKMSQNKELWQETSSHMNSINQEIKDSKSCQSCFHHKVGVCDGENVCKDYFDAMDPKEWAA